MVFLLLRLAVAALMLASRGDSRPGDFKIIGPGGGGAMFHPTISPHDSNTVLVSCDMTGSYITHDAGKSWRMFNLRGVVRFFVFDPLDQKVIYAQSSGLWRSQDQGETWSLIYPQPSSVKGIKMSSDHSDEDLIAEPNPLGNISAMAIDSGDSKTFYVAVADRTKARFALFVSRDGGQKWEKQGDLPEQANRVWVNPRSPDGHRVLLIAGAHFIEKKSDSGVQKIPLPSAGKLADISVGFRTDARAVIYLAGDESAYSSDDEGATWRKVVLGPGGGKMRAIATSLRNPDTAYVSYREGKKAGSSGWEWLRLPMPAAHGRRFGRKTVIPLASLEQTSTMPGSLKDLGRIGEKIRWF